MTQFFFTVLYLFCYVNCVNFEFCCTPPESIRSNTINYTPITNSKLLYQLDLLYFKINPILFSDYLTKGIHFSHSSSFCSANADIATYPAPVLTRPHV